MSFTMRITLLRMFFAFTLVFGASDTLAQCDCIGASQDIRGSRYSTACEEFKNFDAVFYGQVVEMKMIDKNLSAKVATITN